MIKKILNIILLIGLSFYLYSNNGYSKFILGQTPNLKIDSPNSVSVSDLVIEDGKYYLNVSNGYQIKRQPVKLTSEIENGIVNIDYKLSKNESVIRK